MVGKLKNYFVDGIFRMRLIYVTFLLLFDFPFLCCMFLYVSIMSKSLEEKLIYY